MSDSFKALVLEQDDAGKTLAEVRDLTVSDLPEGDVTVRVSHSSINYKDGLAVTGKGKIVRKFPMVPGIDFAGTVVESDSPDYQPGDAVVLTGWGVGERYWGGLAGMARVKSEWLVPLPEGLDVVGAMAIGTAGFTAMLCVMALEEAGVVPDDGPVLVTGASGGVGSMAVALLAKAGFEVAAVTGRPENEAWLRELGATQIVPREELTEPARPLESEKWGGAVDTVGGQILANVLASVRYGKAVAACGLAGGIDLPATVFPFILRGIRLQGVDSVMCPKPMREKAWARLARDLSADQLSEVAERISLEQVPQVAEDILKGQVRGRVIVDL
ncbi:acrylyl-CoA reductase (NADPH) [Alkalispirillum mobile]|uniref:Acrylyl-CoA reductase (NADPH) n=1 Tax=Alkalispirillum mobile TaxID=85925 RepID=A0A498C2G3_9GAMM|nr:MDR family oxidoreductase [Alkalispirillum mobile]RLK46978.1 acrylyl-CoA reductase (NADPH) [Alkalispirillum mobile]